MPLKSKVPLKDRIKLYDKKVNDGRLGTGCNLLEEEWGKDRMSVKVLNEVKRSFVVEDLLSFMQIRLLIVIVMVSSKERIKQNRQSTLLLLLSIQNVLHFILQQNKLQKTEFLLHVFLLFSRFPFIIYFTGLHLAT